MARTLDNIAIQVSRSALGEFTHTIMPLIRLTTEECESLEDDWDMRALKAGLEPADVVRLGPIITRGLILEEDTPVVGATNLRALYRAAIYEPRVEPVMRKIEATGMSIVDLLGGLS